MNIEIRKIINIDYKLYNNLKSPFVGQILTVIMRKHDFKKSRNELINPFLKYIITPLYKESELMQINVYNLISNGVIKNVFQLVNELNNYYGFGISIYFGMNKESKSVIIRTLDKSYDNLIIKTPQQNTREVICEECERKKVISETYLERLNEEKLIQDRIIQNTKILYTIYKKIL
jgi:hypothetical protein